MKPNQLPLYALKLRHSNRSAFRRKVSSRAELWVDAVGSGSRLKLKIHVSMTRSADNRMLSISFDQPYTV